MDKKKVVVIGAGISGLATAYWLKKDSFDVAVLEKNSVPGGAMITERVDGFLVDYGPNSGLETTPLISQLAEETGIRQSMVYANESSNTRYILRDGTLHPLPTGAAAFFGSKLFSAGGKLRLMAEPFIGKSNDGYYQSMAEFVTRRLGKEFLDYAIDPFVSGVFAGDPAKLSVKSAFPKLYRLEEKYGGLIKGMVKGAKERKRSKEKSKQTAKMFSFTNGMQSFPEAIAAKMKDSVIYNSTPLSLKKENGKWNLEYNQKEEHKTITADMVLFAVPSAAVASLLGGEYPLLKEHLDDIYYPPVMVLYLGYKKSDIKRPLDGFGYLIPSKEKRTYLGAIWSSTIFPNRAPSDAASFTLFVGGARSPHLFNGDRDELIKQVIWEFNLTMGIAAEPIFQRSKLWEKAIPQYNLGYIEHENFFDRFEQENPGLFLSGNYRGGISVGDCVKNSDLTARRIIEYSNKE